jgi:5-methylcytosine-specific restriction endonuclease McrA
MSPVGKFLELIPQPSITSVDLARLGLTATEAINEMLTISAIGGESIQLAILQVLLRALETHVLADDELLNVARFRDLLLGQADSRIDKRVEDLFGIRPSTDLVTYLRRCLTSAAATSTSGEKSRIGSVDERGVFEYAISRNPRSEVRCTICGYHFVQGDLGTARSELIRELGGELARSPEPGRIEDELKPRIYSQLEIDHIVPEEGFGWSDTTNLQLACSYCNRGRLIFRRALEPLSTMVAGSLGTHPPSRLHRMPRQVIVVACLLCGDGRCSVCAKSRIDTELTVQLRSPGVQARMWFVPWNLETVCYRCKRP